MLLKNLINKSALELRKAGIKTFNLDVQILLEEIIAKDRAFTYSHPDFLITNTEYARFRRYIRRRKTGEPIAYILGHKEFYDLDFLVNKNVLIPRPETEQLVEWGIKYIKKQSTPSGEAVTVLDIGTGSGCIVIALSVNSQLLPVKYMATDISQKALAVAKKNVKKINAQNITFLKSNLFYNPRLKSKVFDLIIANLPYVPYSTKIDKSISLEPSDAIFANNNGTSIIKKFLDQAKDCIKKDGLILLELDPRNAMAIKNYAENYFPKAEIDLKKDLAGLNRYILIKK